MSVSKDIPLVIACGNNDIFQPLVDGTVRIENCSTAFVSLTSGEMFSRSFEDPQFNVAELSLANYLTRRIRGNCPYVAIPVYASRSFRHGTIYVRANGGISTPQDLRGRRIGIGGYAHTAYVWARAILQHEYGLHPSQITWISISHNARGHADNESFQPPPGVSVQRLQTIKSVEEMLAHGEIDALFATSTPGSSNIVRLLNDHQAVEDDYFRRTQIFPILHIMGLRTELLERYPDLAQTLFKAFLKAKDLALAARRKAAELPSAPRALMSEVRRMTGLMGGDYYSHGVNERDCKVLDAFLNYHFEQGLSDRRYGIADLFSPIPISQYQA